MAVVYNFHNHFELIGFVGKDPESQTSKSGTFFAKFSVSWRNPFKKDDPPEWYNCICFGKNAEKVMAQVHKGQLVLVTGELRQRTYKARDGQDRKAYEIVLDQNIVVLKDKQEGRNSEGYNAGYKQNPPPQQNQGNQYGQPQGQGYGAPPPVGNPDQDPNDPGDDLPF